MYVYVSINMYKIYINNMKLNLNIIAYELGYKIIDKHISEKPEIAEIGSYRFFDAQAKPDKTILYLCPASESDKYAFPKGMYVLFIGNIKINTIQADYLVLEEMAYGEVINSLNAVFDKYRTWENKLQEIVDNRLSPSRFFDESIVVFDNALLAFNSQFSCLFYHNCNIEGVYTQGSPLFAQKEEVTLGNAGILDLLQDENFLYCMNRDEFYYVPKGSRRRCKLFKNVFLDDELIIRLCIDGVKGAISEKDYALLNVLGDFIKKAVRGNILTLSNQPKDIAQLLASIINQEPQNHNKAFRILGRYKWHDDDEYLCITAGVLDTEAFPYDNNSLYTFASNLCHRIQDAYYTKDKQRVIIVCNMTKAKRTLEAIEIMCQNAIAPKTVHFGLSRPFKDLFKLSDYHKQSYFAFQNSSDMRVRRFEKCQLRFFYNEFCKNNSLAMMLPNDIVTLLRYDYIHESNLYGCLKAYLYNDRNIAKAARDCFMHRNTFLYQLSKIAELCDINFNSFDEKLKLMLAIRGLELRKIENYKDLANEEK